MQERMNSIITYSLHLIDKLAVKLCKADKYVTHLGMC